MAKADIDFEKELWDAANELRGALSENNYKNYVLPLVFLKHLSERYDIVHNELKELVKDSKSEYYTTDKEENNYVLDDPDEQLQLLFTFRKALRLFFDNVFSNIQFHRKII
jgi:type I restriction enzyme M protein